MATSPTKTPWITTTLIASMALAGGCGGFSLQTMSGSDGEETAPVAGNAVSQNGDRTQSSSDVATMFAAVSDEENKKLARDFKATLRMGKLAELFGDELVFSRIEAVCGTKIWDQCQVAYDSQRNDLGWTPWSFKRRDEERVYRFPEMLYDEAEPLWAEATLEHLRKKGADAAIYIKMVQDKCGTPLNDGCEVRGRGEGEPFQLTHRESGEVFVVMSSLYEWKADL